jgi:triphosphoribosyl-dephospho-CoA synthase
MMPTQILTKLLQPSLLGRVTPAKLDVACCDALNYEANAWPKPGLVTPVDSGSHRDMNYASFIDSIAALRGYFSQIAQAGVASATYPVLQKIAVAAEMRMLAATQGANTHRGAIFNLGLLSAAAGYRMAWPSSQDQSCGNIVAKLWGPSILAARTQAPASHGQFVCQHFAVGGAREQAAAGFPAVYDVALPVLRRLLAEGVDQERALIGTLMALMAELIDTNLLWRGGEVGLLDVQRAAREFNHSGGVKHPHWCVRLLNMNNWMVYRNLSPGGSADLLAATWLVYQLDSP